MSEFSVRALEPVYLWPKGAPGAMGHNPPDRPRLMPLLPEAQAPTACIVVCPGGAYAGLAGHEGEPVAKWLCGLGVAGVVLHYRVSPYRHPAPLADAQRAIRLVRARAAEWNIDPKRVGILGFSAGGHLATSAATVDHPAYAAADGDPADALSARPDALVACYPVITFGARRHTGSMKNLLGPEPMPMAMQCFSLENRVGPNTPPTFLWHTSDDAGVPVQNSLLLAGALAHHGVKFALHVFRTGKHGLGLAASDPAVGQWTGLCAGWLREIGFTT